MDSLTPQTPATQEEVKAQNHIRSKKSAFCKYYRRGCCTFSASECKFAHGVEDYNFVELKPENYRSKTFPPKHKNPASKKVVEPAKDDDDEDDELDATENKKENAATSTNTTLPTTIYNNFYDYQFILKERGEVTEIYSQEVINEDKDIRANIRRKLNFDMQKGLLDVVFEKYNSKALQKSLIEQYFLHANWMIRWKFLLSRNYIYEIKSFKSEMYIAKQLPPKEFDEYMKDCVIKIVKEKQLFDQLPISPTFIIKHYYQYLGSLDPLMPSHITYLRLREFKSMDDYLNHLQDDTEFMQKLLEAIGKNEGDLQGQKVFGNISQEIKGLKEQIKVIILEELIQSSPIGLISLSECENAIAKKSLPAAKHYFNNLPQLRKIILNVLLDKELATINLDSEIYVFSCTHFHKVDQAPLTEDLHKQIYSKCSLAPITSFKPLGEHQAKITHQETSSSSLIDDHQIDLNKVTLVNDQQSLDSAIKYFSDVDQVGVDIEGLLKDNINIELVQCSSKDKIFIFDVYSVYLSAAENPDSQSVYFNLVKFLKDLMEDPSKCKIFHDCRQDSAALHSFFNVCPSNIFDLSAVYMLIEYLKRSLDKKEETQISEEIKLPGLNEILEKYQAMHGINQLKNVMKERFRKFPRAYFLQRPIDQEFFIYSAKDVEDLVEIKEKMQSALGSLFGQFTGGQTITEDKLDFLCKKVSKIYSQNGCSSLNKS